MDYSLLLIFFKKSQWADDEAIGEEDEDMLRKDSREMAFASRNEEDDGVICEDHGYDQDGAGPQKNSEEHRSSPGDYNPVTPVSG